MNVLSLFDGMSCGQIALDKIGIKPDNYFACEIKTHAMETTGKNYPSTMQLGDVNFVTKWTFGTHKIDLLIGGSPCQDFSGANKNREGINGQKSSLFWEFVRLKRDLKPKYFLLENVRMSKENQELVSKALKCQPIVINSKEVSGQLRHRLYWTNIPFNGIVANDVKLQDVLTSGYTDRLKSRCLLESDSRPSATPVKMFHRYYSTGFTTLIFKDEQHYLDCKADYDANYTGKKAIEIDVTKANPVYEGVRYLNRTELERLQTVPDGYTDNLTRNMSACLLGDGWTVDVISQIFKGIKTQ